MKTTFRIGLALGLLAIVVAASQPAHAICAAPFIVSSLGDYTSYVVSPGYCPPELFPCTSDLSSSVSSSLQASFWHVGNGNVTPGLGNDNGAFAGLGNWVIYQDPGGAYAGYPAYIDTTWGASQDIDGCIDTPVPGGPPAKCMGVLLSDIDADGAAAFAYLTAGADANGNFFLNLDGGATISLASLPKAQIANSVRVDANNVNVTVAGPTLEALAAGLYQAQDPGGLCANGAGAASDVQYKVYTKNQARGSAPPTDVDPTGWTPGPTGDLGQSSLVAVNCDEAPGDGAVDVYVAYTLVFDSGFETGFVSGGSGATTATRTECGPNVAEPGRIRIKQDTERQGTRTRTR